MTNISVFENPPKTDEPIPSELIDKLLDLQTDLLVDISSSEDFNELFTRLCKVADNLITNGAASVMSYDPEHQKLLMRASPSLPREAAIALNGLAVGEGSDGNAVYHNHEMLVTDTATDKRWENMRDYADYFKVAACWAYPIHNAQREIIGSFAISSFEKRVPSNFHRKLLSTCASIAGIIFEREHQAKEFKILADSDPLTGLLNRAKFTEDAELLVRQVKRTDGKMAILYMNIDKFKWINDGYGQDAGDKLLASVAASLKDVCRDNELICRWGGDEFVMAILCKKDCKIDADAVMARVHKVFAKPFDIGATQIRASASCGIGVYPTDAKQLEPLIYCADQAMLKAKSSGGNQVVYYQTIKKQVCWVTIDL